MLERTRSDLSHRWFARAAIVLCLAASSSGCECGVPIGTANANRDGGARVAPRTDECGNGLDDDRDARIDEGCPCGPGETQRCFSGAISSNETGACRAGVQTCATGPAVEWGDWGIHPCEGEVLPGEEACDGNDADCDGAIDEGCPCTDGMVVDCGAEFLTGPCTAGTQTCRAGTWSACEGAVRPAADVCGDAIDNDCDGTADRGCDCTPEPERCRDRVDNDCDGEVDEPACTPDWRPDGGVSDASVPMEDGGVTDCSSEVCGNAIDDDLDGASDEGCAPRCDCTWTPTGEWIEAATPALVAPHASRRGQAVARNPRANEYAIAFPDGDRIHLSRVREDGSLIADVSVHHRPGLDKLEVRDLVWAGDRYILVWHESIDGRWNVSDFMMALDAGGAVLAGPTVPDPALPISPPAPDGRPIYIGVSPACGELMVSWTELPTPGRPWFQRFSTDLVATGPRAMIPSFDEPARMSRGAGVVATTTRGDGTRVTLLRDDAPFTTQSLAAIGIHQDVEWGVDRFLVCWNETTVETRDRPHRCQTMSPLGVPGISFGVGAGWTYQSTPSIAADGCRHLVSTVAVPVAPASSSVEIVPVTTAPGASIVLDAPPGLERTFGPHSNRNRLLPASRGLRQFVHVGSRVWLRALECR